MNFKFPQNAFDACPACRCESTLRILSVAVFCDACGWDSSAAFVDCGALDHLMFEYEEQLVERTARRSRAGRKFRGRNTAHIAV